MVKVLSLFTGIGTFEKALDNLGIEYELVNYSEIDKFASKSYCAIHNVDESLNLGDITKINEKELPKDIDLLTYGFPCVDISLAGKQQGFFNEDGTKTRSGLFFDALRIIEETQPKVAIAENVKNLVGKKFKDQFEIVLDSLDKAGYNNYWKVLNAKDYGIPQNRERVFIISIRKDIDNGEFKFPEPFELKLRLKDMLEDEVDEKYYLSEKMFKYAFNMEKEAKGVGFSDGVNKSYINPDVAQTIGCRSAAHQRSGVTNYVSNDLDKPLKVSDMKNKINMLGLLNIKGNEQVRRVYGTDGVAPTLNTMQGGNRQPKVLVKEATKKGYAEATATAMRGRNNEHGKCEQKIEISDREYANAITTVQKDSLVAEVEKQPSLRIRKLTPLECFRLQGFDDDSFRRAEKVNSNTQLYRQAGNSICVPVIQYILQNLFECGVLNIK